MPFKLKLKKTRQYNVASKNLFVISVELLDGGVADCTLSVDSTGQECLDNVCQRQAITQAEFFGLRYINRSQQPRWVQLERPLKKQLDKYASSHQLYLRVMYYVISGTSLITDEVTRYHYFLQLKHDLIEGRIICDCQQAVVLASYSRQAEYGNHDRERHTVDYLKNLLTFPKQMIDGGQIIEGNTLAETGRLEWLTSAVIQHHMTLHNMAQAQAEEGFISACQLLRGYGQEMFIAHDQLKQNEVTIAISLTGIMLLSDTSDTPHFYRWQDITNVINHKRTFSIECAKPSESASFTLSTPEDGKYVWRVCVQQHTFYMRHQRDLSEPTTLQQPKFQECGLSDSREELDADGALGSTARLAPLSHAHRAHSASCLELEPHVPHTQRRALLPTYRAAPDYETAIQQKYQQQRTEAQMRFQSHHAHSQMLTNTTKPLAYGSHPDIHRVHYPDVTRHTVSQGLAATDDYAYGLKYLGHNNFAAPFAVNPNVQTDLNPQLHYVNVYKPPPPYPSNGLASNSTPDLAVASQALNYHRGYINSHVSGSSPDLVSTRTALNRQYLGYINGGVNIVNYGRPSVMPSTHGTYNNLASVLEPNPHIIVDPHHASDGIQKALDERGNIMYSMPIHRIPYQRHVVLPQTIPLGDANEPIYENVPLPWHHDSKMRDRAQSLTTTDEIARLNERNQPSAQQLTHFTKPNMPFHANKTDDSHYENAQVIHRVRETSVPKDLNISSRSINKEAEFENVALSIDRLSLTRDDKNDETPYQSLSTHKVSNNNMVFDKSDNVTSIVVTDVRNQSANSDFNSNLSRSSGVDSALASSIMNSTYSTSLDLESSANTTNTSSSVSSKEKKRRRWGVFMGRGSKPADTKSATLGRNKHEASAPPHNRHRWSTGLHKMHPLPPTITKETLCQLLERKMSDSQLSFAFEQIPKGRETNAEMTTALLPENAHLNGYSCEYLPYEDNRVKLNPTPANRHGYINASHVTMTVGNTQRFYVVAKINPPIQPKLTSSPPSVEQAALLWECAWLVGARVVATCAPNVHYLPSLDTTKDYGKYRVSVESYAKAAWGGSSRVRVQCGARSRVVWHVGCAAWPGEQPTLADTQHWLGFLSELSGLRLACATDSDSKLGVSGSNAPVVLCCSHGERSGTALAADLLLHTLDNNQELDIPRTISLLHQQRANLLQTVHQYRFLHQLLLHYLTQTRLI